MNIQRTSVRSRRRVRAVLTFSPEFEPPLRHHCRYQRCRSRLPAPVINERDAFCSRGCFTGYFRSRCLVCERPFERKRQSQTTCGRRKCNTELWRDRARVFGKWWQGGGRAGNALLQRLAAARWLRDTPLARVHLLNPRPSMPPGHHIEAGGFVGGDSHDYCWLVWSHGHNGKPTLHWLLRDKGADHACG